MGVVSNVSNAIGSTLVNKATEELTKAAAKVAEAKKSVETALKTTAALAEKAGASGTPSSCAKPGGKFETPEEAQRKERQRQLAGGGCDSKDGLTPEAYRESREQKSCGAESTAAKDTGTGSKPETDKKAEATTTKSAGKGGAETKSAEKNLPPHGASDELTEKPTAGKSYKAKKWTPENPVSLSLMAKKAYGDSKLWPAIWGANQEAGKVQNKGDLIKEGDTFKIPKREWTDAFMKAYDPKKQNIAEAAAQADKAITAKAEAAAKKADTSESAENNDASGTSATKSKKNVDAIASSKEVLNQAAAAGQVSQTERDQVIKALQTGNTENMSPKAAALMAGMLDAVSSAAIKGGEINWKSWLGEEPQKVTDEERKAFGEDTKALANRLRELSTQATNEQDPASHMVAYAGKKAGVDVSKLPGLGDAIEAGGVSKLEPGSLSNATPEEIREMGDLLLDAAQTKGLDVGRWVGYEPKDGVSSEERERFNRLATQLGEALVDVAKSMETAGASESLRDDTNASGAR